jgi:heat shock protein HslJ
MATWNSKTRPDQARTLIFAVAAPFVLAGCAMTAAAPTTLAGTHWQLVSIESMADEQPIARPPDASRYTLAFGTDGRVALRLDCNRMAGTWQDSPAAGGSSGGLTFGPLAGTRAMCPPASLEPRIAKALPYVRGYLLKDGRLHLSLLADGGILTWAPAPP